jgi:hypothetical protein
MRDWESEKRRREQELATQSASDAEAERWYSTWEVWTPHEAARHFASDLGPAVFGFRTLSADGRKIIYRNQHTGWTLLVDVHNRYFTIHRPQRIGDETHQVYVSRQSETSEHGKAAGFHFRMPPV